MNSAATKATKRLEPNARHKDMYVAIHDAFAVARRRLEDHVKKVRRTAKARRAAAPKPGKSPK